MTGWQDAFLDLVFTESGARSQQRESAPAWLRNPGRDELRGLWDLAQTVYARLTDLELPATMPPREHRRLDALLEYPNGKHRILEIDEEQHFRAERLTTLDMYPAEAFVAFDVADWRGSCDGYGRRAMGGGFAKPKPPLFPGAGGRHRQRAYRDFLADLLPPFYEWLPTLRVSKAESLAVLADGDPGGATREILRRKERPPPNQLVDVDIHRPCAPESS